MTRTAASEQKLPKKHLLELELNRSQGDDIARYAILKRIMALDVKIIDGNEHAEIIRQVIACDDFKLTRSLYDKTDPGAVNALDALYNAMIDQIGGYMESLKVRVSKYSNIPLSTKKNPNLYKISQIFI